MDKKSKVLKRTNFHFLGQKGLYRGKVSDVYDIENEYLVKIVTDRISAYDKNLPYYIPYKGQVLNQIAAKSFKDTEDIVPNWVIDVPNPMVMVGHKCEPFKVEMVIRGYLTGHAWREYKSGKRIICGVEMPDGMRENQKFPNPIITPTTKADFGNHDEDISKEEIIALGLVKKDDYEKIEGYTRQLFERGTILSEQRGLILVDTKYEFGKKDGKIYLIDEIHTPDSSRYFYIEGYRESQKNGNQPKQLSKEFVRQWLIENGFEGKVWQTPPYMSEEFCLEISERYIELYEAVTGEEFERTDHSHLRGDLGHDIIQTLNLLSNQ